MRIKLLVTTVLMGFAQSVPKGSVVESDNEANIAEFKALIAAGYAKETTEDVTSLEEMKARFVSGKKISGISKKEEEVDPLSLLLVGTVADVSGKLEHLSADQLAKLAELEVAGSSRKGVADAIAAQQAALAAK